MKEFLRAARRHRAQMWLAVACSALNKVFDLAPPFLIGTAVDIVVRREESVVAGFGIRDPMDQVTALAIVTAIIWALESAFEYAAALLWRNLAQRIQHEIRVEAYAHVQGLELAYYEDRSTGGLMSILNDDINQLERFLDSGADEVVQTATTAVCIGGWFFYAAPQVAWMAMLPMPFILWGSIRFTQRIAPRYADVRGKVGELNATLANNLGGIATIKSFVAEQRETERVSGLSADYMGSNRRAIRLSSAFGPLIRIVILCGFTATLVFGARAVFNHQLEAAAYAVMVFLTQRLLWPLTRLGTTFDLYHRAVASTRRVLGLLETETTIRSGSRSLAAPRGEVRFEQVEFHYSNGVPVLRGVDLVFPAGETTAIVGATGAGKSTIVKLLLRFYDPTGGRLLLDGVDLRELDLADLRMAMGLVSQDVFLFHGSVRDNIAYGEPDAPLERIVAAAKVAEAHEFISALPEGYDTVVGERGQKLSGGQRQRVSIARAILTDPPILVLDEATSSVDNETEAAIQRALDVISRDRTTIVIAHRLSTIRHAHRIHVLDRGGLREHGTHEQLLEEQGLYASLWNVQTGVH